MEKHLKAKHKTFHIEFEGAKTKTEKHKATTEFGRKQVAKNPPKQSKISDYKPAEKWNKNNSTSKKIDDLMLRYICLSNEPLSQTEKSGFSELFEVACPRLNK